MGVPYRLFYRQTAANSVERGEVVNGSSAACDVAASARGARAYGHVSAADTLSRSKNVVAVSHPFAGGGLYCITLGGDIDLASAVLIAEPDFLGSGTSVASDNASV